VIIVVPAIICPRIRSATAVTRTGRVFGFVSAVIKFGMATVPAERV
jgi:hypothetical protein